MVAIPFGPYEPDLPRLSPGRLIRAENSFPAPVGYAPVPSFVDAGYNAIDAFPRGAVSAVDASGFPYNFIGNQTKLYRIGPLGLEDVSKLGGYNCSGMERWEFALFGGHLIACNYNDPTQYFTLATSTDFADLAAAAPRARHCAVVGNFLVLGNLYDALYGSVPDSIWWSAIGNPFSWPTPGTDLATQVQSDRQPLSGSGGAVNAIVAGAEVGAILQENALWRMDYRGGAQVFELTRIEQTHGLLVPGLAVPFGRFVFYLSEEGFRLFDYQESKPIGKGRIDETFFADFDSNYPNRVWTAKDPDSTRIWIVYPGAGNTGGRPNRALFYDYALDRFSHGVFELEAVVPAINPVEEHLDTLPADDLDAFEPTTSFDEAVTELGPRRLGAIDANLKFGTLSGASLTATFETGDLQLNPAGHALTSLVRPMIQGATRVQCAVSGRGDLRKPVSYTPLRDLDRLGACGLRRDARYHRFRTQVEGGWDELVSLEVEAGATGTR